MKEYFKKGVTPFYNERPRPSINQSRDNLNSQRSAQLLEQKRNSRSYSSYNISQIGQRQSQSQIQRVNSSQYNHEYQENNINQINRISHQSQKENLYRQQQYSNASQDSTHSDMWSQFVLKTDPYNMPPPPRRTQHSYNDSNRVMNPNLLEKSMKKGIKVYEPTQIVNTNIQKQNEYHRERAISQKYQKNLENYSRARSVSAIPQDYSQIDSLNIQKKKRSQLKENRDQKSTLFSDDNPQKYAKKQQIRYNYNYSRVFNDSNEDDYEKFKQDQITQYKKDISINASNIVLSDITGRSIQTQHSEQNQQERQFNYPFSHQNNINNQKINNKDTSHKFYQKQLKGNDIWVDIKNENKNALAKDPIRDKLKCNPLDRRMYGGNQDYWAGIKENTVWKQEIKYKENNVFVSPREPIKAKYVNSNNI